MNRNFKIAGIVLASIIAFAVGLVIYTLITKPNTEQFVKLDNGYSISKYGYRDVRLEQDVVPAVAGETEATKETIIEPLIIAYSTNSNHVAVKVVNVPNDETVSPDFSAYSYYILNMENATIYGPLTEDVFTVKCQQIGTGTFDKWLGL